MKFRTCKLHFGSKVIFYFRPGLHFWESNLTATISSENVILQYYTTITVTLFHFHQKFKNEITVKALLQGYFDLFQIPNTIKILNITHISPEQNNSFFEVWNNNSMIGHMNRLLERSIILNYLTKSKGWVQHFSYLP